MAWPIKGYRPLAMGGTLKEVRPIRVLIVAGEGESDKLRKNLARGVGEYRLVTIEITDGSEALKHLSVDGGIDIFMIAYEVNGFEALIGQVAASRQQLCADHG